MKFLVIVVQGVLAAVLYGIVHDQITIRICPEYFTIAHPHISDTKSLTLLAVMWGVIATWWVGLPLGIAIGLAARVGRLPKLEPRRAWRWMLLLLFVMGTFALVAGGAAWAFELGGKFREQAAGLAQRIAPEMHNRFVAAYAMHLTSYIVGAVGGVTLAVMAIVWRYRESVRIARVISAAGRAPTIPSS